MRALFRGGRVASLALIIGAAMLWGTVGVTTNALYTIAATNPLSIGFFRLAFAAPLLWIAGLALSGRWMFRVAGRDLALLLLIGAMLAVYQACYFGAIARVGVTVATLVTLCLAPVLVAMIAPLVSRERLTPTIIGALVLAVVGISGVVGGRVLDATQPHDMVGVVLAFGSALGYAIVTMTSRRVAGRYPTHQINAIGFTMGALVLLPLAQWTGFVVEYNVQGWMLLAYLGIIPTALAYGLFVMGMRGVPATVASIATLVEPLTAAILAAIFFGERLGPLGLLGAAALLGALVWLVHGSGRALPAPDVLGG